MKVMPWRCCNRTNVDMPTTSLHHSMFVSSKECKWLVGGLMLKEWPMVNLDGWLMAGDHSWWMVIYIGESLISVELGWPLWFDFGVAVGSSVGFRLGSLWLVLLLWSYLSAWQIIPSSFMIVRRVFNIGVLMIFQWSSNFWKWDCVKKS